MGKKTNPARKEKYKAQYAKTTANKLRKLMKHLRKHPNDRQAENKVTK